MNNPVNNPLTSRLASVTRFFAEDVAKLCRALDEVQQEVDPAAMPQLNDMYHQRVLQAFEESQVACKAFQVEHADDPVVIKDVQAGFLIETDPWFTQAWIGERARTKPAGFVGDYEMLIKLYNQKTPARGLGGYLDLCIQDLPLARAVRTRLKAAREFLLQEISQREGDVRILDVASGPCREYHNWPESRQNRVEVVAMDTDPTALQHVAENVCPQLGESIVLKPERYNALRTRSAKNTIRNFGKFDIIYSVGLCDYLTDEHLVGMLAAWHDTLNDDGVMYVAFKDCNEYDETPYQWHLDWFFYQRTQQDVLNLFEQAGFDLGAIERTQDETGIITNYIIRRRSGVTLRVDEAESGVANPANPSNVSTPQDD